MKGKRTYVDVHRKLVATLSFLLCFMLLLAAVPDKRNPRANTDSRIHLIHSDVLYKKPVEPRIEFLVGHVKLNHEGVILSCDSAKFYREENSFDAFGHVVMTQGDTLKLLCDSLYYDGFEMKARARGQVTLHHNKTKLVTQHMDYDRMFGVGMYLDGGTLYDGDNVLVSDWGQYTPAQHEAFFTDNVQLTNPKFVLVSDTLYYYTNTETARIMSPTNITSEDGTFVYGERGTYHTKSGMATLLDRSYIIKDMRRIIGDSLYSNKEQGFDEAFGHVALNDDENACMLVGNYCKYFEETGDAFATDSAVLMDFSTPDTFYIHADTLRMFTYNLNTDSVYRNFHAYHKVRMYRRDVQGVCDSLAMLEKDSCTYMHGQPILWNGSQQVFGEEIRVYNNDSTVDSIYIINQAMTIEQIDSASYNQVSSQKIQNYFLDGEIEHSEAHGNVYVTYFIDEDDGSRIGMNYSESTDMKMFMENKKVVKVWMPAGKCNLYPDLKIPKDRRYLTGFAWFDYIRPKSKDDLFEWRGKSEKDVLKKSEEKVVPIQSLDNI